MWSNSQWTGAWPCRMQSAAALSLPCIINAAAVLHVQMRAQTGLSQVGAQGEGGSKRSSDDAGKLEQY